MGSDLSQAFAATRRGLVIGPAGYGKTHLIAETVRALEGGRQLILTHTHAGVRAIRDHLGKQCVLPKSYQVSTIDGFALRFASCYPHLSNCTVEQPTDEQWTEVRAAAICLMKKTAIRNVLTTSYTGVFVDEYQDCDKQQHLIVRILAELLPCRIVGDPLQAVFNFDKQNPRIHWQDIAAEFPCLATLTTPWRWTGKNGGLGNWLNTVRATLLAGNPLDLRSGPTGVEFNQLTRTSARGMHIKACFDSAKKKGTIAILAQWPPGCYAVARNLRGAFTSMETVECQDLLDWADKLQNTSGTDRVEIVFGFAKVCMANAGDVLDDTASRLDAKSASRKRTPPRNPEILSAACAVAQTATSSSLVTLLRCIEKIPGRTLFRRELWTEMVRTLQYHEEVPEQSLRETAWQRRDRARRAGRRVDPRTVSRPLLVKGLEFDHAVVLNADELPDAESLYVAMTRASQSLVIFAQSPVIQRPCPAFMVDLPGQ